MPVRRLASVWVVVVGAVVLAAGCGSSDTVGPSSDVGLDVGSPIVGGGDVGEDPAGPETGASDDVVLIGDDAGAADEVEQPVGGAIGEPCEENTDCFSGFCVDSHEGPVCSKTCDDSCPEGWTCSQYQGGGADLIYVCLPSHPSLCRPCDVNADCLANGVDDGARCVSAGDEGSFCGGGCDELDCPDGYTCAQVEDVTGATSNQCVLAGDSVCSCSPAAVLDVATTTCAVSNEIGSCGGTRSCGVDGLSACDAAVPAVETCNGGVDDDCDGAVDEEDAEGCAVFYLDVDEDGLGVADDSQCLCAPVAPYTASVGGDCDDGDEDVSPTSPELCNGVDDDCDGETDEGFQDADDDGIPDCVDADLDGDGDPDATDCAPADPNVYIGAEEVCDGVDNNCNQIIDEGSADTDQDGAADCVDSDDDGDGSEDVDDCAPLDGTVHPGADEVCDGVDNDCEGGIDEGFADLDTDGTADCVDDDTDGDGDVNLTDCAPLDAAVSNLAEEVCDGDDQNCNQIVDEGFLDSDADGVADCVDPDLDGDLTLNGDDCAPLDPLIHPAAEEACDGVDQDCNGLTDEGFADLDTDGLADCVDGDVDGDDVANEEDNCEVIVNPEQEDADGDEIGDACDDDIDGDGAANADDCEPLDAEIHPEATEQCDGVDDDCDGETDETFGDTEGDGIADCMDPDDDGDGIDDVEDNCAVTYNPQQEDLDTDGVGDACENDLDGDGDPDATDCSPLDDTVFHGAAEICDGDDDNCNAVVDEGYGDGDGDGVADCIDGDDDGDLVDDDIDNCPGVANPSQVDTDGDGDGNACDVDDDDDGVVDELDCADTNADISPLVVESCNDLDDDCDGVTDEENAEGCDEFHFNADSDSWGIELASKCLCAPSPPFTATQVGDCNDSNGSVFPGATEVCNGIDDDCDEESDEAGAAGCALLYEDGDYDNWGTEQSCVCPGTLGYAGLGGDCDDSKPAINPGAQELCGDDVDNDCDDGTDEDGALGCVTRYRDEDEDTFGVTGDGQCGCEAVEPYTALLQGDCNDSDPQITPIHPELCDIKDNNCNGQVDEGVQLTWFKDNDGDDFGGTTTSLSCEAPEGFAADSGDCNDFNDTIYPGAPEVCNDLDDNCNGPADDGLDQVAIYKDNDGDGFASAQAVVQEKCDVPVGWTEAKDADDDGAMDWDCDDSDVTVFPEAASICGDDKDNDCDGYTDRLCMTECVGNWPFQQAFPASTAAMRGDLDGDGNQEIITRSQFGFAILDHQGFPLHDYSAPVYNYARRNPVLADIDEWDVKGAGRQSLEVLSGNGSHPKFYKLEANKLVTVYDNPGVGVYDASTFLVRDLDFDGQPEFVTTTWCEGDAGAKFFRFDRGTGSIDLVAQAPDPAGVCQYTNGRTLTDLDGDGIAELVFSSGYSQPTTLQYWSGAVNTIEFTDMATLASQPWCPAGACFDTAIPDLFGGSVPQLIRVGDEIRAHVSYFTTQDPSGANESTNRFWRWDTAGALIEGPTETSTISLDNTDVNDDGTPESVGSARTIGLFDVDGDGFPDRVRVSGNTFRLDRWDPEAGWFVEQEASETQAGAASLTAPVVWDVDSDGRLDVIAADSAGRVHCRRFGEDTWNPATSLPPHDTLAYRTKQWDNHEPNDGTDTNADGMPDQVMSVPSALTAKGEFYSWLSAADDVDFFRIDAAWGGQICLQSPKDRTYSLRIYAFSDKLDNVTGATGGDGAADGLIWEDASDASYKCFTGSGVLPTRHGEYHFIAEIGSVGGDFSPYWPYWINAPK